MPFSVKLARTLSEVADKDPSRAEHMHVTG